MKKSLYFSLIFAITLIISSISSFGKHVSPTIKEISIVQNDSLLTKSLLDEAKLHLGVKYIYGATGPKAFDCSGFTSYVYRQCGIIIPRTSNAQSKEGDLIESYKDSKPGDLIFFSSRKSGAHKVGHVGMIVENDTSDNIITFIHASCSKGVTYQQFPDNGYFSKRYICIKRLV